MTWHTLENASYKRNCTIRHIRRLIASGSLTSETVDGATQVWLDDADALAFSNTPDGTAREIQLSTIPHSKVTDAVVQKVRAMLESVSAQANVSGAERAVSEKYSLPVRTQRFYKTGLRRLFNLQKGTALYTLAHHPQIRQALEHVIARHDRSDSVSLRKAHALTVVVRLTGETIPVEDFLKSLYPREGVNSVSCYRALLRRAKAGEIVHEDGTTIAPADLPSERGVRRFLAHWREENVCVRRGRSRKHDWEVEQEAYVTRDVSVFRPGELWIGDHTELDFIVLNERGKPDRRWITSFIDIRSGLIVGSCLSWQPCSQTIALAYRQGALSLDLKAWTVSGYKPVSVTNIPEVTMIDNGKDYKSNYTKRIFGKIDFSDIARASVERITRLHYVLPYHGQSKAQQERWYRTIQAMLKYLPGFKGNKYQNKPDTLEHDLKRGRILTVEVFDKLVEKAICTYNNRARRSLKGQSPLECYLTNETMRRTIDARVLDFLLMKSDEKTIHRCQVKVFGEEYYSDQLLPFNGKRADIYYDPRDLGLVSVYVGGEFAAVASNKRMMGRDETSWREIVRDRKRLDHDMQIELKKYRGGMTDDVARLLLAEGELTNVTPVSNELLDRKEPVTVTMITGLEGTATRVHEERKEKTEVARIEREARNGRRRANGTDGLFGTDGIASNIS